MSVDLNVSGAFNCFFVREKKLAKKYYDKLFKEYCIADLSRYKENKVGHFTLKGQLTSKPILPCHC